MVWFEPVVELYALGGFPHGKIRILQGQSQLSIGAASAEPLGGWQRMQVEHSDRFVWVSPIAAQGTRWYSRTKARECEI